MGKLTYIVIHCTDTPVDMEVTADTIRRWHTDPPPAGRGWSQVGYSEMFYQNGQRVNLVQYNDDDTVDSWEVTNGVKGKNSISRHIVYCGGAVKVNGKLQSKDTLTPSQFVSIEVYLKEQIAKHPDILIAGHYQFDPGKQCPSFFTPDKLRLMGIPEKNIYNP